MQLSLERGRWVVWLVVALMAAGAALALSIRSDDGTSSAVGANDVAAGWNVLADPPVAPRLAAALSASADEVLLFGGRQAKGDVEIAVRDGAVLDLATGEWQVIPEPPPEVAAFEPAAVATSKGWLVVGESCASGGGPDVGCGAGGTTAALLDPAGDRWAMLPPPPQDAGGSGRQVRGLGVHEDQAFFLLGSTKPVVVSYDVVAAAWTTLPEPPLPLRSVPCLASNGVLVGLTYRWELDGTVVDSDPSAADGFQSGPATIVQAAGMKFNPTTGAWSKPVPLPGFESDIGPTFLCTDTGGHVVGSNSAAALGSSAAGWSTAALSAKPPFEVVIGGSFAMVWGLDETASVTVSDESGWRDAPAGPSATSTASTLAGVFTYSGYDTSIWGDSPRMYWYVPGSDRRAEQPVTGRRLPTVEKGRG